MYPRVVLAFNTAVFGLFGLAFILSARFMADMITGGSPTTGAGLTDMRATYGGFSLGFSALLFMLNTKTETRKSGLLGLALILAGMTIGRVTGLLIHGEANMNMYIFLVYEIVFTMICLHASRHLWHP